MLITLRIFLFDLLVVQAIHLLPWSDRHQIPPYSNTAESFI